MSRALNAAFLATALLSLAACNTAKPAPQMGPRSSLMIAQSPSGALQTLRSEAENRGGRVVEESANSMFVDFGVATRRVPIPTEYGLWGTRVSFRDTEVHSSAYYVAEACAGGTRVSIFENPIYWHPDYKSWLPGPYDTAPGVDALRTTAGAEVK